jgi:hypothetical protein
MARKPIAVRLNDEEAELREQAARIDAVSRNEFVKRSSTVSPPARLPCLPSCGSRAVKANQRVIERLAQT